MLDGVENVAIRFAIVKNSNGLKISILSVMDRSVLEFAKIKMAAKVKGQGHALA